MTTRHEALEEFVRLYKAQGGANEDPVAAVHELFATFEQAKVFAGEIHDTFAAERDRARELSAALDSLRETHDELAQSERRFRSLVTHSSDATLVVDDRGLLQYVSPSAQRVLGIEAGELLGKSIERLVHPDDAASVRRSMLSTVNTRAPGGNVEFRVPQPGGGVRFVDASITCLLDDPAVKGIVLNTRNITERVAAERALRETEAQLTQAQKLESIGRLAAGVAHEINTPMQYVGHNLHFLQDAFATLDPLIDGYGALLGAAREGAVTEELVREVSATEEQADLGSLCPEIPSAIEQSLEGVAHVTNIVRAMQRFSHPGSREKTDVDLNAAVEDTIAVARNEWKYVAEVETDLDPELPFLLGLPGELNQVILNLIVNAAHAIADVVDGGSDGMGTITVSTRCDGDWAEIRITDTGTGIPEEIRSRVFDPFFTTKEVGKGTGQGLALARSTIVDRHGGTISFESANGEGTTFIIRLPLDDGEAAAA